MPPYYPSSSEGFEPESHHQWLHDEDSDDDEGMLDEEEDSNGMYTHA